MCWPNTADRQFSKFKPAMADLAVEKIGPIGDEMRRLLSDPAEIDSPSCAKAVIAPARLPPR